MPRGILMLAITCLVFTPPAEAATTWLGAQLDFPVPASDVGNAQLGLGGGVTVTAMEYTYVGTGFDLAYHYWPASSGYEAAFDRYLRTERLEALAGSDWALSALQLTGHVKLVVPAGKRYVPWMQVGAGVYRLNLNLDQRWPADVYARALGPGLSTIRLVPGGYGAIGLDVHSSSPVVFGVDATLHYIASHQKSGWGWGGINDVQDFSAITVGAHAMFGLR
jgi:hypothetical protein